jgi:regulation of enolase protein 1 (concanavalin A-like superfamily)
VKVGLEYHNGAPSCSSVCATSEGADWVVASLPQYQARRSDLRVKLERIGCALWVYYEDQMLGWKKLREVTWFFWGVEDKAVRVGVYLSRPANWPVYETGSSMTGRDLLVEFEGLEIF